MKKTLRRWAAATIGAVAALVVTSCAYDPYYSSADSSYGYGDGYGYGGSSFSTSVFISTGDSRWGYDPYCHSYYDYHRRAYYDPYLYGYYPVGYRPAYVYGVPHPHGWRPGSRYCPPPSRISGRQLSNYRNRDELYRRSNYSWANQVRQRDNGGPSRGSGQRPGDDRGRPGNNDHRPDFGRSPQAGNDRNPFGNNTRPVQRPSGNFDRDGRDRGDRDRSPYQRRDFNRPDFNRPDRGNAPQQRPSVPDRSRESRQRYSPQGFNSPVGMNPGRSIERPQAPPVQRQQMERPQTRERSFERPSPPQRSRPEPASGGGRERFSGGGDGERGDRRGR